MVDRTGLREPRSASQAASAIANARACRDEQRARADLEALVETSPFGVVVFNDEGRGVAPARRPLQPRRRATSASSASACSRVSAPAAMSFGTDA